MVMDIKRFQMGANDEIMKFRQTRQIESGGQHAMDVSTQSHDYNPCMSAFAYF